MLMVRNTPLRRQHLQAYAGLDIDLPKKPSETGVIKRLFLDPTASHLIISTALGENFYLHTQSRQPKQLSKLKGISIECIAWNPSQPTASTREILIGAADGSVYETYIESATEFLRREDKYLKVVYRADGPVAGIWADVVEDRTDSRRVLIATPRKLLHFFGRLGRHGHEGSGSIFAKLFETETPRVQDVPSASATGPAGFATTPESPGAPGVDVIKPDRIFAWLHSRGILYGPLLTTPAATNLGDKLLEVAKTLNPAQLPAPKVATGRPKSPESATLVALTQWHILMLIGNRIVAVNRLDESIVFDTPILDTSQRALALLADQKKNTFWLFTTKDILEIVVTDEDRDIWKVMLKAQKFEEATFYANTSAQKDAIATASGDYLLRRGQFMEAASVYGKSSKPFEQVALAFIDANQKDALRKFLLTKLSALKKTAIMQRIMLASWLTEIFMAKLNSLDDLTMTKAELSETQTPADVRGELASVKREFQDFCKKYKADLNRKTVYDIISSHGREEELLYFSLTIDDYNYILSYWVQRENWPEALKALNRQTDPNIVYKYSSVLMSHTPTELIDILMRQSSLDARKLIPAFLNYNQITSASLDQNQAVRYLLFEINQRGSTDSAIHNTLLSIYASHSSRDESLLLAYLQSQTPLASIGATNRVDALSHLPYDADFALRLCIQHARVRACVHIYSIMGQYASAVSLALQHNEVDLAINIAETTDHDAALRKKLWLAIARAVISSTATLPENKSKQATEPRGLAPKSSSQAQQTQTASITTALSLLHRAPPGVLRIEDLLPLFPDFVLIDAFRDEIIAALSAYSASIDTLKAEMDASAAAAQRINREVAALGDRWVLVEPGEACAVCGMVLVEKRFWVWGCGHGAHASCAEEVYSSGKGGRGVARRVKELKGVVAGGREEIGPRERLERAKKELDEIVGRECVRCGEVAVRGVDEPFVGEGEDKGEWAL